MAYERDKDRYTRGVGAIAALDHANPARMRHRALVRRRSNRMDSAKAEYTYRPGGGIGAVEALGRVNLSGTKAIVNHYGPAGDLKTSGAVRPPGFTGGGGGMPTSKIPTRLYGGAGSMLQNPAVYSSGPGSFKNPGGAPMPPRPTRPIGPLPLPTPPGSTVTTRPDKGSSSGGGGGGGGGGGWGAGSGTVPSYPGVEEPAIPDIPDEDTASSSTSSPSVDLKTVALVGGAAVAAWWLFFRDKKGGTP